MNFTPISASLLCFAGIGIYRRHYDRGCWFEIIAFFIIMPISLSRSFVVARKRYKLGYLSAGPYRSGFCPCSCLSVMIRNFLYLLISFLASWWFLLVDPTKLILFVSISWGCISLCSFPIILFSFFIGKICYPRKTFGFFSIGILVMTLL